MKDEDLDPGAWKYFGFYLNAFRELSTCRNSGFGPGPIPFTAIEAYARVFEVEDFFEFLGIIRQMDYCYLELKQQEKSKSNGNTNKNNKSNSGRR